MKFWKILLVALCKAVPLESVPQVLWNPTKSPSILIPSRSGFFRLGRAAGRGRRRLFV